MALDRLRHYSKLRRRVYLGAYSKLRRRVYLGAIAATVNITLLVTVILTVLALSSSATTADRLAAAGDVMIGATLLLAAIAAEVALLAFAVSTGPPDLKLQFTLPHAHPNEVRFDPEEWDRPGIGATGQVNANIIVRNASRYAARTPAVSIEFRGAGIRAGMYAAPSRDWTPTARDPATGDILALQWDGGPNYSIHGNSPRHLPDLFLQGLYPFDLNKPSEMIIRLLADGYDRAPVTLPIDFSTEPTPLAKRKPPAEWL